MSTFLHPGGRASGKATSKPPTNPWRLFLPVCLPLLLVFGGTGAFGQRLLNVVPLGDDPTLDGWTIEVDHDLVRSAPQRLELAAPDGRVLTVEMRLFEDRGDGNAMWTGGYPELGYESVVLTLQDGYLLGRFGLPEGGTYWIRSGGDGSGRLTEGQATGGNCGGGIVPEADPAIPAVEALRTDPPRRVAGESNHDRLDILVLYTASAAQRLDQAGWGTPAAFTQLAMDYLNLVLQNNQVDVSANIVHHQEAPAVLGQTNDPLGPMARNSEVYGLRAEHDADLVHLFFNTDTNYCGLAYLMTKRFATPQQFWSSGYGITSVFGGCVSAERLVREDEHANQFETFAHEIGHNLGANHDRDNTSIDPEDAVYPYAFGHHNFTPQPNVKSVMSYNEGQQLPYFSTVRVRPGGWDIGVANERENERAVQQTVHIAVQFSDHLPEPGEPPPQPPPPPEPGPRAPTGLQVMATGSNSVKLTWTDESNNENGFEVESRLQGARWQLALKLPADAESADVDGLRSGGRYDFRVRAYNRGGRSNSNVVTIVLPTAEYTNCEPLAAQITFEHGYTVSMCIEYENQDGETVKEDAKNYGLDSRESGLLYFFDRDNAEVLVKVLDACRVNGFRWVFVAPVTTLAFNLYVDETATEKRWTHRNPKGDQTATTASNIRAFPCEPPGSSTASQVDVGGIRGVELVDAGFPAVPVVSVSSTPVASPLQPPVAVAQPISGGEETDCVPQPVRRLRGGYTVNMCVEYIDNDGETVVAEAKDYDLDSEQSGILYFFNRDNAEVLIKVLDGCAINGHRWVFVAPVTTLAFNLTVESPDGAEVWTHQNYLNDTAAPRSNIMAFACGS